MKSFFYAGLILLGLFEILNVYFIMPMPGSQQMNSVDLAYFLYSYRWFFRVGAVISILIGSVSAFQVKRKWIPVLALFPVVAIAYVFNFRMTADHMFLQPQTLVFKLKGENTLSDISIVVAVSSQGESAAEIFADPLNTETPSITGAVGLVPSYSLLDVNSTFALSSKVNVRFNINNITNNSYFTKRPTMYPGAGVWPSDGRSINLSVEIKI